MSGKNVVVRKMNALEALGGITGNIFAQIKLEYSPKKKWLRKECGCHLGVHTLLVPQANPLITKMEICLMNSEKSPYQMRNEENGERTASFSSLLQDNFDLEAFLNIASMANLAHVHRSEDGWKARGDPTEIAIQIFASRFNWNRERWTAGDSPQWKQIAEFPFSSSLKKMSVIFEHKGSGDQMVFTKGAVERVISSCPRIRMRNGEVIAMTDEMQEEILNNMEALAAQGLRVLALAGKSWDKSMEIDADHAKHHLKEAEENFRAEVENDLIFHGLIGLYDPPHREFERSVQQCHQAGIAVHMLTSDHPETARAIAAQVGILPNDMSTIGRW